jgi:hypothetical protein
MIAGQEHVSRHTGDAQRVRIGLGLILAMVLAQGLVWALITPAWSFYDETAHYEYMRYISKHRDLPRPGVYDMEVVEEFSLLSGAPVLYSPIDVQDCRDAPRGITVCFQPGHQFDEVPGYYLVQATFQVLFSPKDVSVRLILGRVISVLMAVLAAYLGWLVMRGAYPESTLLALGVPALMGVITGYSNLMSSLNNDVGAVLAYSLMTYAGLMLILKSLNWKTAGLMGLATLACIFSKSSAWIGLPLAAGAFGIWLWPRMPVWLRIGSGVFLVMIVPVIFTWEAGVGPLIRPTMDTLLPISINHRLRIFYDPVIWPYYLRPVTWQFVTFWSGYGAGAEGAGRAGITLFALMTGIALVGLGWRAVCFRDWSTENKQGGLFLLSAVLLAMVMSFLRIDPPDRDGFFYYIPTARHFMVAIIPTVAFLRIGWAKWIPRRWQAPALGILALCLYLVGIWSLFNVQLPYYAAGWIP